MSANPLEEGRIIGGNKSLDSALRAWIELLGPSRVSAHGSSFEAYQRDCRDGSHRSLAIISISNLEELRSSLRIAGDFGIPVYPVSRGCNWGYGTMTPAGANNVIFDLSGMNRILKVSEELAYAVVEPGVTQAQLAGELEEHYPSRFYDVTGSSPDASVLGNLLERGYGMTPYADHFLNSAGMEVILADGSVLSTGFGRFSNCESTFLFKNGIGPYLDGLFTQSNFAIISKVGIWLMPKSERMGAISFKFAGDEAFAAAVPALRELKLRGLLRGAVHIANDLRVISSMQQYPFELDGGSGMLSEKVRKSLWKKWKISAWNAVGGIWGSKGMVKAELSEIRKGLRNYAAVQFVSSNVVDFFARHPLLYKGIFGHELAGKRAIFGMLSGKPSEGPLLGTYWRKRKTAPSSNRDPARDGCGILWCSPVVPLTARDVSRFLSLSRSVLGSFNLDVNIGMTLISERACSATVGIYFDREDARESEMAEQCRMKLLRSFVEAGYVPYRAGSDVDAVRSLLFPPGDPFMTVCNKIKHALDPAGLLAPGRYGIGFSNDS